MAIILPNEYPNRANAVTTARPQGSFKNRSAPGAQDGSYLDMAWANDIWGYFGALLNAANVTPNETVDTAAASQYFDALQSLFTPRFNQREIYTTTGNHTFDRPANAGPFFKICGWGGGAGGENGVNNSSIGPSGGSAGGYFEAIVTNIPESLPVSVGAGGSNGTQRTLANDPAEAQHGADTTVTISNDGSGNSRIFTAFGGQAKIFTFFPPPVGGRYRELGTPPSDSFAVVSFQSVYGGQGTLGGTSLGESATQISGGNGGFQPIRSSHVDMAPPNLNDFGHGGRGGVSETGASPSASDGATGGNGAVLIEWFE